MVGVLGPLIMSQIPVPMVTGVAAILVEVEPQRVWLGPATAGEGGVET